MDEQRAFLITLVVGQIMSFFLAIFQSIQSNHFKSECFKCCAFENDYTGREKNDNT